MAAISLRRTIFVLRRSAARIVVNESTKWRTLSTRHAPQTTTTTNVLTSTGATEDRISSLGLLLEKLKSENFTVDEAVRLLGDVRTTVIDSDQLNSLKNDAGFEKLCSMIGKKCVQLNNNAFVSCLKNALSLNLPPSMYVLKSLETEFLWRMRKMNQRNLALVLSFHVEHQNDELQAKVVRELIAAIQRRWVEIDNVRDVALLLQLRSHFARDFQQKLEDRAIETMENASRDEIVKLAVVLGQLKIRPPSVLRSLSFHLTRKAEKLSAKQATNALYAMNTLNFPDQVLLTRLSTDLIDEIPSVDKPSLISAVLTCIGQLRWKHLELLDVLSDWIFKNLDKCRPQDVASFVKTTATLNYSPPNSDKIFNELTKRLNDRSIPVQDVWLDVVWSLVVHQKATDIHLSSVLNPKFCEKMKYINNKLKLGIIDASAKLEVLSYKGPFMPEQNDLTVPISKEMQKLNSSICEALNNFLPKGKYMTTNKIVLNSNLIDAEFVVDSNAKPLPLQNYVNYLNSSEPMPSKVYKVALLVRDFKDYTLNMRDLTGGNALAVRLLKKMNYTIVEVSSTDFINLGTPLKKVQYLQNRIKQSVENAK